MNETNELTPFRPERREFTLAAVLAILSGVTITVTGCGGGGDPSPAGASSTSGSNGLNGSISSNHGHAATIAAAQLTGGGAVQLDIRGAAQHTHTVELSATDVQRIRMGSVVSVDSTVGTDAGVGGDHRHSVTFDRATDPGDNGY